MLTKSWIHGKCSITFVSMTVNLSVACSLLDLASLLEKYVVSIFREQILKFEAAISSEMLIMSYHIDRYTSQKTVYCRIYLPLNLMM